MLSRALPAAGTLPNAPKQQARGMAGNAVLEQLRGLRGAMQLPPNPFTYRPKRFHGPTQVLYRGPGMLLFRFLVRAKVFQLAGAFTAAALLGMLVADGDARSIAAAVAVGAGCVVTSYCVWFYSGRYVGRLALALPGRDALVLSVLDFWGNRQDDVVPLAQLDAPFARRSVAEVRAMARHVLLPVKVRGGGGEYYISMGHGKVEDERTLLNILYGRPPDDDAAVYVEGGMSESERSATAAGTAGGQAHEQPPPQVEEQVEQRQGQRQ